MRKLTPFLLEIADFLSSTIDTITDLIQVRECSNQDFFWFYLIEPYVFLIFGWFLYAILLSVWKNYLRSTANFLNFILLAGNFIDFSTWVGTFRDWTDIFGSEMVTSIAFYMSNINSRIHRICLKIQRYAFHPITFRCHRDRVYILLYLTE